MISLALTLSIISLVFVAAGIVFILRLYLNPKDDPRLGRGLQILQSKISVVEDLSKQVDKQSEQIISLLEHKIKEVQEKIFLLQAEEEKLSQKQAELKSIIRLFQDRIPFEEIAQRQLTVKYVRAAKLAHQGKSVEEIAKLVDLPFSELNMICKMNREHLVFSEENLPEWIEEKLGEEKSDQKNQEKEILREERSGEERLGERMSSDSLEPQPLVGFQDKFDFIETSSKVGQPSGPGANSLGGESGVGSGSAQEPILVMPNETQSHSPSRAEEQQVQAAPLAKPSFSLKGDLIQVQKVQFPRIDVGRLI
jgi:CRISPR/Cas system-associated endoribonuclease Cas2